MRESAAKIKQLDGHEHRRNNFSKFLSQRHMQSNARLPCGFSNNHGEQIEHLFGIRVTSGFHKAMNEMLAHA